MATLTTEQTNKLVKLGQLAKYQELNKTYIDAADAKSFKAMTIDETNGQINFFKTEDGSGTPAYTVDITEIIKDKYLDLTKTAVVNEFAWSETNYPNSTNPNLDGKPVVVFVVTNGEESQYSFASLADLIDVYTGVDGETAKVSVSADNKITVEVKISAEVGNVITKKTDGLYVDVSNKANIVGTDNVKADQILIDDGSGDIKASGKTIDEVKNEIIGTDADTKDNNTVKGAKAYADSLISSIEYATDDEIAAIFA